MRVNLTANAITAIINGDINAKPLVQVVNINFNDTNQRYWLLISDGVLTQHAMLAIQLNERVTTGQVIAGSVVQLIDYVCHDVISRKIVAVVNMETIIPECEIIGNPKLIPEPAAGQKQRNKLKVRFRFSFDEEKQEEEGRKKKQEEEGRKKKQEVNLTANAITAMINGDINAKPLVQVLDINFNDTIQCYLLLISDGVLTQHAMLAIQLNERVTTGQVIAGSVVQLIDYFCQDLTSRKIIVVVNMETIIPECEIIGNPKLIPEPAAGQKQRNKLKVRFRFSFDEEKQEEEGRKKKQEEEGRKKKQEVNLTANAITAMINGDINAKPLVQVLDINFNDTIQCYLLLISDGVLTQHAMLAIQLNERVTTGQVIAGSVVQLIDYFCQDLTSRKIIVVVNMETIIPECEIIGNPKLIPEPAAGQKQRNKLKVRFRFSFDEEKQEEEGRKKKQEEEGRKKKQEEEGRKKKQEVNLTANAITAMINGDINAKPLVQVLDINFNDTIQCYLLLISDGVLTQHAMLAIQLNERVTTGQVIAGSVVQLIDYFCQDLTSRKIIVVVNMETIIPECEIIGNPKLIPEPAAGQKQRNKLKVRFRFSFDEEKQEEEGRKKKQEEEGQEEEERKKKEEEEERKKKQEEEERKKKQEEEERKKKQEEELLEILEMLEALLEEQKMEVMEMLGMVDEERKQEQEEQRMKEEEEEEEKKKQKEAAEDWIMETLSGVYQSRCQICLNVEGGHDCVQCGRCEGWVHTCCAGVTMDYAKAMPSFICPRCKNMAGLF